LTYVNYLPMSTVKGGDPSGHGEGSVRGDINAFEYVNANVLKTQENDLPNNLRKEIGSLGSDGTQKLIKQGGLSKFKREGFDSGPLKKALGESLWSLFAAETPVVFAAKASEEEVLLIWHASLENFLHTIMLAYPYAYDFTEMHTKDSQKSGLAFALKEAG